jgi:hypothetical protein
MVHTLNAFYGQHGADIEIMGLDQLILTPTKV